MGISKPVVIGGLLYTEEPDLESSSF